MLALCILGALSNVAAFWPHHLPRQRIDGRAADRARIVSGKLAPSTPPEAAAALGICREAATTKKVDGETVIDALLDLEQVMARAAKEEGDGTLSRNTLAALDGAWRLVFTTGTVDTQNKLGGKINYFPIKAVQCFDTATMTLSNGIFLGDVAVLKFFGSFDWLETPRRLEFDFDRIAIFGLAFDLPKGGAEKIGASTGLGSENNVERAKTGKKAFFKWISADGSIAVARGGGGGLALWQRDLEMETAIEKDKQSSN
jgi:hypothetical protein